MAVRAVLRRPHNVTVRALEKAEQDVQVLMSNLANGRQALAAYTLDRFPDSGDNSMAQDGTTAIAESIHKLLAIMAEFGAGERPLEQATKDVQDIMSKAALNQFGRPIVNGISLHMPQGGPRIKPRRCSSSPYCVSFAIYHESVPSSDQFPPSPGFYWCESCAEKHGIQARLRKLRFSERMGLTDAEAAECRIEPAAGTTVNPSDKPLDVNGLLAIMAEFRAAEAARIETFIAEHGVHPDSIYGEPAFRAAYGAYELNRRMRAARAAPAHEAADTPVIVESINGTVATMPADEAPTF